MDGYYRFLRWMNSFVAVISALATIMIKSYVEKISQDNYVFSWTISLIAAYMLFYIIVSITKYLVDNSIWIRKLLLGKSFIEGFWVDIVYDKDEKIMGGGIVNISFVKDIPKIEGDNFSYDETTGECKRVGGFYSTLAQFNGTTLEFSYLSRQREANFHAPGYARYDFIVTNSKFFKNYDGYFFGSDNKTKITVLAKKISDKQSLEKLKDLRQKAEIVKEFVEENKN